MPDDRASHDSKRNLEWCLSVDGMGPGAATELCAHLQSSGYGAVVRNPPVLPSCELRVAGNTVELKARLADERRSDPIEMSTTFSFDGGEDFIPFLSSRVEALLARTIDYCDLVQSIRSGKTIAFIGSGLSRSAGYPDWRSITEILVREAAITRSPEELAEGGERALSIAEECKEKLGSRYFELLAHEFGEKTHGYTTTQEELLRTPFASYITTNIDPCLEVAAEHINQQPGIQIWPVFTNSRIGSRDIFYIHGKVPRSGQNCGMERIRMTTTDYKEAYVEHGGIAKLITQCADENFVFMFIGYGLREPAIKEVLKASLDWKKADAEYVRPLGISRDTSQMNFALVPEGEIPPPEVAALLEDCQVRIIDFPVRSGSFIKLEGLVDDLLRRTVQVKAPLVLDYGGHPIDSPSDLR